jgi:hypothetical protein
MHAIVPVIVSILLLTSLYILLSPKPAYTSLRTVSHRAGVRAYIIEGIYDEKQVALVKMQY